MTPKYAKFDIDRVLERLLLKGSIVVKKAYCDWDRYKEFKAPMHEASFELIEIPHVQDLGQELGGHPLGRGRARSLLHQGARRHLRHHQRRLGFLAAGQQAAREQQDRHRRRRQELDLGPADRQLRRVHFLRRPGAAGRKEAPARAPQAAATAKQTAASAAAPSTPKAAEGRRRPRKIASNKRSIWCVDTIDALAGERDQDEKIWGSMVKQTLKRRNPGFNESYFGFRTFSDLLEEAQTRKLLTLEPDQKSGGYIIRRAPRPE